MIGPLTYALCALLAAFGGLDAAAHFLHYRMGWTFSALVWWIERRWPIARLGVASACLVLFTHLVFQIP